MKSERKIKIGAENIKRQICRFLTVLFILSIFALTAAAQQLPDKIRGYKVKKADVTVGSKGAANSEKDDDLNVEIAFDEPELAGVGLTGITLELGGAVTAFGQSGTVDFITFKDFVVGGIKVNVREYNKSFDFKKNDTFKLKEPIRIFVPVTQAVGGIFGEVTDSKEKWRVTGRIFVFGRFNKMGFKFKRVIPVDVDLLINNPLKSRQ